MADTHVDVRAATQTRCNVVNVVVHVLVNAGLKAERSDDPRVVVLLAGVDESLSQFEGALEERFSNGGGVVSDDRHFGNLLADRHGHLLRGRQADMTVKR